MVTLMKGNGRFDYKVVGTSHWQPILQLVAGPKIEGGCDLDCLAALAFQDDNPHDSQAVVVFLVHEDQRTTPAGYLDKKSARAYRKAVNDAHGVDPQGMLCRAKIVGGAMYDDFSDGLFGVRLDLELPLSFGTIRSWENWKKRLLPPRPVFPHERRSGSGAAG